MTGHLLRGRTLSLMLLKFFFFFCWMKHPRWAFSLPLSAGEGSFHGLRLLFKMPMKVTRAAGQAARRTHTYMAVE